MVCWLSCGMLKQPRAVHQGSSMLPCRHTKVLSGTLRKWQTCRHAHAHALCVGSLCKQPVLRKFEGFRFRVS